MERGDDPCTCGAVRVLDWAGSESFIDAASEAVSGWRYAPATIGGRPVDRLHRIRFTFKLRD